jgi:hypothetical protein
MTVDMQLLHRARVSVKVREAVPPAAGELGQELPVMGWTLVLLQGAKY